MNKKNKLKQLNRTSEHRQAMINNMVTSLFKYERVESTVAKIKVVRSFAEKLITRAKKNLHDVKPEVALHNKREVMKKIKNRGVVVKLFEDIAPRFKDRNGGYTRIFKLVNRASDNSEVGILELVERKSREQLLESAKERRAKLKEEKKSKTTTTETKEKTKKK
jgi:large subunit ribosomal protein L17